MMMTCTHRPSVRRPGRLNSWLALLVVTGSTFAGSQIAAAQPEQARAADAFVDSIGVTTHYHYFDTPYGNHGQIEAALVESGIRHIRDGNNQNAIWDRWKDLYDRRGIKVNTVFGPAGFRNIGEVGTLINRHPEMISSIEGPNEPDVFRTEYTVNGTTYTSYEAARRFQSDLYARVKGDSRLAHLPVLSPSLAHPWNVQNLAPLTAYDGIAVHAYPGGQRPTDSLGIWTRAVARLDGSTAAVPAKPMIVTETGYHNAMGNIGQTQPGVSEAAEAKYLPRLHADFFNRGIARTFSYELFDLETSNPNWAEGHYGLVRSDYGRKPVFNALKNLIALTEDPGPAFTPGSLDYTITGGNSSLQHMLLQKRNGEFLLALWQDALTFDTSTKRDLVVPDMPIELSLNSPFLLATTFLPNSSAFPTGTYLAPEMLRLNVPDHILLVQLTPVPEPAGALLLAAIAGPLALARRRRSGGKHGIERS